MNVLYLHNKKGLIIVSIFKERFVKWPGGFSKGEVRLCPKNSIKCGSMILKKGSLAISASR